MKDQSSSPQREVLAGLVERVTFHNADSGFCVLRTKARGHRELVTVVGHVATISAGEWITATGEWTNAHTHGHPVRRRLVPLILLVVPRHAAANLLKAAVGLLR